MKSQGYEQDVYGNWQPASYFDQNPGLRKYQEGGWAMTPQVATLAERGPEMVITKSQLESLGGGSRVHIENINIDGARDVDQVANELMRRLREDAGVKF